LIPDLANCPTPATEDRPLGETREYHPTSGKTLLLASAWMSGSANEREPSNTPDRFIYTVALDTTPEQNILRDYRDNLLLVLIAGFVISAGAGTYVARQGIRPIHEISAAAHRITANALAERVGTYRTVSGATLFLPKNWSIDFSFLYAESDGDANGYNEVSDSKLNAALAGTLPGYIGQYYNPFVDQGVVRNPNEGLANGIRITQFQDVRSSLLVWALRGGGEIIDLPGGPITAGLGLEYQSDDYVSEIDHYTATFDVVGLGAAINGVGKRYVRSAYYQLSVPILGEQWSWAGARSLQLVISERYDD